MRALVVVLMLLAASPARAERLEWDFWPGETAASMMARHRYSATINGSAIMVSPSCDDVARICLSQSIAFGVGTHTITMIAWWDDFQLWSDPTNPPVIYTVPAPPPPPVSRTCTTSGVVYQQGATLGPVTLEQRDLDRYLSARLAEGWSVLSQSKVKNKTTVRFIC